MTYSCLGHSPPKKDVAEKAVGRARFGADFSFPELLIGKILHSPQAHARILRIDTSRAEKLPGVKAVITHEDTPHVRIGRWVKDRPILAWGKVRYIGEPVAAVAAMDADTAEEALELIRVDYEPLPAVFSIEEAMASGAPLVHDDISSYQTDSPLHFEGNILNRGRIVKGEVGRAWAECDFIHEDSYRTQVVHQGFIQPHEATAVVDASGKVTVWSSTKAPFLVRDALVSGLGLPMSRIRVIAAAVGGDFGGKGTAQIEPMAILLAQKSGKPVRLALTREEEFTSTYMREATISQLKIGAKRDGTLVAVEGRIIYDTGAYCDLIGPMEHAADLFHGPYRIPHVDITALRVYTNNTPRGHFRAPVAPQAEFPIESHLDMLARKMGLDPVELRLKNALEEGDHLADGATVLNPGIKETLLRTKEYLHRERKGRLPNRGWGVASCHWGGVRVGPSGTPLDKFSLGSAAIVKVNEDGSVVLITGVTEQGCGPISILSQIVAEVLGVPYESVSVICSDTDATPYEGSTGGSQTTYRVGNTVRLAAEDARSQLQEIASERMEVPVSELEVGQGKIYPRGALERGLSIASLASAALMSRGGPILGTGRHLRRQRLEALVQAAQGKRLIDAPQHATHAVEVEVDPETGQVRILRYFACHDVGFAISPQNIEGQIEGGIATGLGYALSEEVVLEKGQTLNPNFTDYRLPTTMDMPQLDIQLVEIPSRYGPYGAKGIGEPPTIPVAPAIANAIYDAVGVRLRELPMTSERVFLALQAARRGTTP